MGVWESLEQQGPNLDVLIWELRVSGVNAYELDHSLRKLKLAEDCFHSSWWFMSAHHIKLTGKVAVWDIRKQKNHRSVSQTAMMHLDTIVNP